MKRVITYGTFDLIHKGHINILRRAKQLGDYLIVGLSTDEFNKIKNKDAFHTYAHRKLILEAIRYVDQIIPETNWDQKPSDIKKHQIDTFVMGDDWSGQFDYLQEHCEVVYLPRTKGVSTSKIKHELSTETDKK